MKIKNYTSTVPASKTIAKIEELLCRAGASAISKNIEDGEITSLHFRIKMPQDNRMFEIQLPANAKAVYDSMREDYFRTHKRPRENKDTDERMVEQAGRTAWKLMYDWLAVQLSLIQMQQVDFAQVFLSFIWDGEKGKTFYQLLKDGNLKALPAPAADDAANH